MPSPDDVSGDDLYNQLGKSSIPAFVRSVISQAREAVSDPTDADGWAGILIPALVTAIAINALRRFI